LGALFLGFAHNSFAILIIAQWLSKNHAHSNPIHGTSISIPSVLTAVPNFIGQLFRDGIMKNRLYGNEPFLQEKGRFLPIILYAMTANRYTPQTVLATDLLPSGPTQTSGSFSSPAKPFLHRYPGHQAGYGCAG
jgi:hypothetical protein